MMKKLELEEIKRISFEVLCAVRDVCNEHNLSYSLTGGTLIGAIRHKGFIPWDDDIDIMMPRPDYDKFIQIVKKGNYKFNLMSAETCGDVYGYPFAKACHVETVIKENEIKSQGIELGVYVDIFPVDGMGKRYKSAKLRCMMFQFLHGLKITSNWTKYHKSKLRKWYYEPFRYVCYLISKILRKKTIDGMLDRFVRKKPYDTSIYAGRVVGDFGSKEIMKKELFENKIKIEFEGDIFDAVSDYDIFLTSLYGDYMKLPPIEKQITHHEFEAYWKNT